MYKRQGYTYAHDKFRGAELTEAVFLNYGHENMQIRNNYVKEAGGDGITPMSVSYTHLDVYKRQYQKPLAGFQPPVCQVIDRRLSDTFGKGVCQIEFVDMCDPVSYTHLV